MDSTLSIIMHGCIHACTLLRKRIVVHTGSASYYKDVRRPWSVSMPGLRGEHTVYTDKPWLQECRMVSICMHYAMHKTANPMYHGGACIHA